MSSPDAASQDSTLPVEYGGFWIRVLAAVIDTILISVIVAPFLYWIYGKGYFENALKPMTALFSGNDLTLLAAQQTQLSGPADILFSYVLPAIAVIFFWIARQATPGKIALSLKIVDATTLGPLGKGQAIGRYLGYYVSIFGLGLGLLWVAFDPRKQGWHDKLARTVVIRV